MAPCLAASGDSSAVGGVPGGKAFKAVQIGGPLGGIFGEQHLDLPMTFEDLAAAGGMLGHAGIVVYDGTDERPVGPDRFVPWNAIDEAIESVT